MPEYGQFCPVAKAGDIIGERWTVLILRELLLGTTPPPPVGDESMRILAALEQTGGNRRRAAELLGMSRATFYRRLKSLGLKP